MNKERYHRLKRLFVWRQILVGMIVVLSAAGLFLLLDHWFRDYLYKIHCFLLGKQLLVYTFFSLSELISLVPPEVFILAVPRHSISMYLWSILLLSVISYGAALVMYFFGALLCRTSFLRYFLHRYRRRLRQLRRFGGILVVLSAFTPIPFAIVCCLVGAIGFSFRSFAAYAMVRYLRFALYAGSLWYFTPAISC